MTSCFDGENLPGRSPPRCENGNLQRERDNILQITTWQAEGQTEAYKSTQVW